MSITNELKNTSPKKPKKKGSFGSRFVKGYVITKNDSVGEVIRKIIFYIALIALIFSGMKLYQYFYGDAKVDKLNKELANIYTQTTESTQTSRDKETSESGMLSKFVELYAKNNDLVGWIDIPNTEMSFPVLQTDDNSFYLTHDFNKNESKAGAIFADYRFKITQTQRPDDIVLYGHNMKSGQFFHPLLQYKQIDYFKEHPIIEFDSLYSEDKYRVFACFITGGSVEMDDGNFFNYHSTQEFKDEQEFDDYYEEVMKRTYFNTDVDVEYGDELLTLSTCSYEYNDARTVVVARKLRDNESEDIDTSKIAKNDDVYQIKEWHEIYDK